MSNFQLPTDIHNYMWNNEAEKAMYVPFSMLRPKIYKDGNQWCVLLGENIQTGVAGFGDTPVAAIQDFNSKLYQP